MCGRLAVMPIETTPTELDLKLLDAAVEQAEKSMREGGIPIGAAIGTPEGEIVGRGHNERVQKGDSTAHAEIVAMRNAGRRRDWHTLTLASTLSPCVMCSGAAILHRVPRVVIGESDTFLGAEDLMLGTGITLVKLRDDRCVELMRRCVEENPDVWNEDIGVADENP